MAKLPVAFLCAATVLSAIGSVFDLPEYAVVHKHGFLNQVFVKWGWAWTLTLLLAFVTTWSLPWTTTRRALKRLAWATLWWIVWTQWFLGPSLFHLALDNWPWAECSNPVHDTFEACRSRGHRWISFDISGHSFLLSHGSLLIADVLELERRRQVRQRRVWTAILSTLLSALLCLWLWMFAVTNLYYHTWPEKLIGTILGCIGMWAIYK
jgi:hypothetical protein